METRFTDRIESAIREERRLAASRRLAVNNDAAPGAADEGTAGAGANGTPHPPSAAVSPAHRSADQQVANAVVSTGAV